MRLKNMSQSFGGSLFRSKDKCSSFKNHKKITNIDEYLYITLFKLQINESLEIRFCISQYTCSLKLPISTSLYFVQDSL